MMYGKSKKGYFVAKNKEEAPATAAQAMDRTSGAAMGNQDNNPGPGDQEVLNKWNKYRGWLETKGMAGSPELDKGGLGFKMMDQFNAEMKSSDPSFVPLTKQDVGSVQGLLKQYKAFSMNKIMNDPKSRVRLQGMPEGQSISYSEMNPQQKEEFKRTYMAELDQTGADMWPGSKTTLFSIPDEFIRTIGSTGVQEGPRRRVGFATDRMQ